MTPGDVVSGGFAWDSFENRKRADFSLAHGIAAGSLHLAKLLP
jgi:hypothetical protein